MGKLERVKKESAAPAATRRPLLTREVLREAVLALQAAHIESASLDARMLLQHALGITREALLLALEMPITPQQYENYQMLIAKRIVRQPVSQLLGRREFWGLCFKVTPATLDPRPDSETLVEAVLEEGFRIRDAGFRGAKLRILDLGTGTGCLLLSLLSELPQAKGVGVDSSPEALAVAKENALALGFKPRADFVLSHWCEKLEGVFDIIISNPPYIPAATIAELAPEVAEHEPLQALDGGADGMNCYREIMGQLRARLAVGGIAVFELGIGQQKAFEELAEMHGFKVLGVKKDLGGIPRAITIT